MLILFNEFINSPNFYGSIFYFIFKKRKMKSFTCGYFDFKEAEFLISILKLRHPKISLIVGFGIYSGLRVGDILDLKWYQILNVDYFLLNEKKTSKKRVITFNSSLKTLILDSHKSFAKSSADFVFLNRYGTRTLSLQYINRTLKKVCLELNISVSGNLSTHSLRKTFGRRVYENFGKSDEALMLLSSIFNHTSPAVTRRYLGIKQEEIANIYLNL